jgi:hypothetical protein
MVRNVITQEARDDERDQGGKKAGHLSPSIREAERHRQHDVRGCETSDSDNE